MTRFATIDQVDVSGKRVLLRADLNVPMKNGEAEDRTRIERLAPTVAELADKGARVVIMSHFGRPKGKPNPKESLRPLVPALEAALRRPVRFADDCIGVTVESAVAALKPGEILLLENTRFHKGEEANDSDFAKALAKLGDIYVNDAFSVSHRAHASTEGIAHVLPSYAGRLMQAELEALNHALGSPQHPVAAIVGGAKVSTKLDVLHNLLAKVDVMIVGGAMANTLLLAQGVDVGKSLAERDMVGTARDFLALARKQEATLILPVDAVVARALEPDAPTQTVAIDKVPAQEMILDVGAKTVAAIEARLGQCRTLVWNGPVGAFETKPFDRGTTELAKAVARLTTAGRLVSIAGGGDTVAALAAAGVTDALTYVSAAGGAFLEWLEGRTLPGIAALERH